MAQNNKKTVYSAEVYTRLTAGEFAGAFALLRSAAQTGRHPDLIRRLETTEDTYRMMLRYLVQGVPDEGRATMLDDIRSGLRDVAQQLDRRIALIDDPRLYFSTARLLALRRVDLKAMLQSARELNAMLTLASEADSTSADMLRKKEEVYESIFNHIWTSDSYCLEDSSRIAAVVAADDTPLDLSCLIIAALLLALLQYYDSSKMQALLEIYENARSERIAARTLTSIVLAVRRWCERVRTDRKTMLRLEGLKDSLVSYRRLREILMTLIRTRDTDRVSEKMRTELIPGLKKVAPDMINSLRETAIRDDAGLSEIEGNPEWEEILEKSGLAEKMRELSEMQSQGADLMMATFSHLKTFPFFRTMSNWFIPFTFNHSQVFDTKGRQSEAIRTMLGLESIMCDSDKFSFALMLDLMPSQQRDMAVTQLDAQMEQFRQEMDDQMKKRSTPEFDMEVTRYSRDLYRFFKLFMRHTDFADPFKDSFSFIDLPVVGELMGEPEILRLVGEFYFKRGYYAESLPMLRMLADEDSDDPHLWEKIGYCLENLGDDKGALECYVKAELFNPDNLWLVKRLARTCKATGRWADARSYASRAVESEPENMQTLADLADIEEEAGNTVETLKILYKLDYLKPSDKEVWRRIARLETKLGNFEKGETYMGRLMSQTPEEADYLLAGHIAFARRDLTEAASMFRMSRDPKTPAPQWRKTVIESISRIAPEGTDFSTLPLLLDKIEYDWQM